MAIPEPHLQAWRGLLNAHAALTNRIDAAFAEAELPPLTWYDVLWAVRKQEGRRARLSGLAGELTVSRGGMTKLVDRLERAGLLAREQCAEDRRGSYAVLTDEGEEMLRRMWRVYSGVLQDSVVDRLSSEQAKELGRSLLLLTGSAPPAAGRRPARSRSG